MWSTKEAWSKPLTFHFISTLFVLSVSINVHQQSDHADTTSKTKDATETWPICTAAPGWCAPGHGWATENTAERWKDSKSQGGQLTVRTKASASYWVRGPFPCSFWPCSPATAKVAGGTYGRCTHLCTPCARNREEFSWNGPTSHEGLYLNDTAGKGLKMVPLLWCYKQFSYDSTPAPSPLSYSTPGTLGGKHLTKIRGLAIKKTLWCVPFNLQSLTRNSWWWQAWDTLHAHAPPSPVMGQWSSLRWESRGHSLWTLGVTV